MSEAMALERITQIRAELDGYLTQTRVPYTAKRMRTGDAKNGKQQGDLDLIGLGPREELLVAECKGYGTTEEYQNWCTQGRITELAKLIDNCATNIKEVSHSRWDPEFRTHHYRPTDIWIVFPGRLFPKRNPKKWRLQGPFDGLLEPIRDDLAHAWQTTEDTEELERKVLQTFEQQFSTLYSGIRVRLLPVHRLLEEVFQKVPDDMCTRRKRYPDTALELIRWMVRIVWSESLNLSSIQVSWENSKRRKANG